jgi:hypothetical protein
VRLAVAPEIAVLTLRRSAAAPARAFDSASERLALQDTPITSQV